VQDNIIIMRFSSSLKPFFALTVAISSFAVTTTTTTAFSISSTITSRTDTAVTKKSAAADVSSLNRKVENPNQTRIWSTREDGRQQPSSDSRPTEWERSHVSLSRDVDVRGLEQDLEAQLHEFDRFFARNASTSPLQQSNFTGFEVVDAGKSDQECWRDFALVSKKDAQNDPIMRLVSSELGIREFLDDKSDRNPLRDPSSKLPDSSNLPLDVLFQRTLDTIEDVAVHLRRLPHGEGKQIFTREEDQARKTVVLLGSGWAAHAFMKVIDCRKIRLIVVSPVNHFVFTPMLASSAVGTVEYRSMTETVRAANPCIDGA
jgi:hypothetical protein